MADAEEVNFKYRLAKVADIATIRALFDSTFPIKYDAKFYDLLEQGLDKGSMLGVNGKMVCVVAEAEGEVVGAIVLHTMSLAESRRNRQLAFDLLEKQDDATLAAYVLLLAVDEDFRRQGVASDLIYHGTMRLGDRLDLTEGGNLRAIFCHTQADDAAATALYRAVGFSCVGRVPKHYTIDGKPRDARVWVLAMQGSFPATYKPPAAGELPDLGDAAALVRVKVFRLPPFWRGILVQFGLPILGVVLLYAISYALVVLGPLKGISGDTTPAEGADLEDEYEL